MDFLLFIFPGKGIKTKSYYLLSPQFSNKKRHFNIKKNVKDIVSK